MNKKGNQLIIGAIVIILLLLALGIIKNPFAGKPDIQINSGTIYNVSYGVGKGTTVDLTLINPTSEAIDVNWVIEFNPSILQINQLSQQVSFGMIISQHLFAGEKRDIKMGVAQINSFSEGKQVMNLYLCPKDKCLTQSSLATESIAKKTITFNVKPF